MNDSDIYDPKFWKWSTFYYNPQDTNGFVPRKNGLGLTPNYAHKTIYFILAGMLIVAITIIFSNLNN